MVPGAHAGAVGGIVLLPPLCEWLAACLQGLRKPRSSLQQVGDT